MGFNSGFKGLNMGTAFYNSVRNWCQIVAS